jgi:hypothetical protein
VADAGGDVGGRPKGLPWPIRLGQRGRRDLGEAGQGGEARVAGIINVARENRRRGVVELPRPERARIEPVDPAE